MKGAPDGHFLPAFKKKKQKQNKHHVSKINCKLPSPNKAISTFFVGYTYKHNLKNVPKINRHHLSRKRGGAERGRKLFSPHFMLA